MGKELAANYPVARRTFEEADEALGYKLSQLCFEGPEEKLKLTEITQPAILTASVAAWRVLRCNPLSHGGFDPVEDQRLFAPRGTPTPSS